MQPVDVKISDTAGSLPTIATPGDHAPSTLPEESFTAAPGPASPCSPGGPCNPSEAGSIAVSLARQAWRIFTVELNVPAFWRAQSTAASASAAHIIAAPTANANTRVMSTPRVGKRPHLGVGRQVSGRAVNTF